MADEKSLVEQLFTTIEDVIFYGDRLGQGQIVSMMSPGQFLSTNLVETRPSDLFVQFDVTDPCLGASFIRQPLTSTLSKQYEEILSFDALPAIVLTEQQLQQIGQCTQICDSLRSAYEQYQTAFITADADYQTALNNPDTNQGTLAALLDARTRALQEWDTNDIRQTYDTNYAQLLYLQSGNPLTFFQKIDAQRQQYKAAATAGDFYRTLFEPPISQWATASWTKAVLDTSSISSSSYSQSTSYSGGLSVGWGMFSFGGSGGHSETYQHDHMEATKLVASLEYQRVKIARPWFVSDIFNYRFWTWKKTHGFTYLSDGVQPPSIPSGTVPVLPLEMLVVRNVTMTADFTESDNQKITSHISGGASFGIGPFSISGSYTQDTSQVTVSGVQNGASISIAQPQILAFLCSLTPQSPNPDPSLPWQGDECPITPLAANAKAEALRTRAAYYPSLKPRLKRAAR